MFETYELWEEIMKEGGPKKISAAVGRDVSTCYKWARHPLDVDPDGTGSRGVLDWFEAVVETLATRPSARPALRRLRLWTEALFRRCVDGYDFPAASLDELRAKTAQSLHHTAKLIEECSKDDVDCERAIAAALETSEQLARICFHLERMVAENETRRTPSLRRA